MQLLRIGAFHAASLLLLPPAASAMSAPAARRPSSGKRISVTVFSDLA